MSQLSSPHRPFTDLEQPGDLRDGALFIIPHPAYFVFLRRCQGRGPATDPAAFTS
jgi:hypothetical protein